LHLAIQYLLLGVSVVGYFDKLFDVWWIDFFIFGSDKHRCDSDELIVFSLHLHIFSESVDQFGGDEESFWQKLEISVNFNEPMHQNLPHSVGDFLLTF
jgi:hypothetical protein|tara:strand:+ start:130 stop:423 length:294 start_codon:yes stop_codon:yes gene_type:complete